MRNIILSAILICATNFLVADDSIPQTNSGAAGFALTTMFSPLHAPPRKTMGLLQRSFVDSATRTDSPLQVAIVADGTESMTSELAAVRESIGKMLADLRRCRGEVTVAIVVYRDSMSDAGETEILVRQFTSDQRAINDAVTKLTPRSGEPYFHELADVGLHTALTQLPWSEDPATNRWILWFGDSPPYATDFSDDDFPKSCRRYANELLITVANRKNIQINGVICQSNQNVLDSYSKTIVATRDFVAALAEGTDGLMLDLSYPEIRSALVDAGMRPSASFIEIAPISSVQIEGLFGAASDSLRGTDSSVRVAVLPVGSLDQMSFNPSLKTVQAATALRHHLSQIPGLELTSPVDIQRQLRRLKAEGVSPKEQVRAMTARLGVDYLVWGEAESATQVQTVAYRREDGLPVVSFVSDSDPEQVVNIFMRTISTRDSASDANQNASEANQSTDKLSKHVRAAIAARPIDGKIAESPTATREILMGMELLEQSLGYQTGDPQSERLLLRAEQSIESAIKTEPQNALAFWLQANIAMNQAAGLYQSGQQTPADQKMQVVRSSMRRAFRSRAKLTDGIAKEIEADNALLVKKDFSAAIKVYEELTDKKYSQASQRRAHWMLAGLRSGDWGVASGSDDLVDTDELRNHIIAILAQWPDSSEATLLKRWLKWDDRTGSTQFHHFPRINTSMNSGLGT